MEYTIQLDRFALNRLRKQLVNTQKCVGLTVQWLVWDNMRLAMLDAIKYTAPWAKGQKPGTGKAQRATGESAIVYDLAGKAKSQPGLRVGLFGKITGDMDVYMEGNWSEDLPNHNLVKLKSGAVYLIDKNFYMPTASLAQMQAIHYANRGKNGRVSTAGQSDLKIGRWKAKNKYFVPEATRTAYIKSVKKRVGSLKASWIPALAHYATKVGGNQKVAAWVKRQAQSGTFSDAVSPNGTGAAVGTSTAHHANGIRRDTIKFIEAQRNKFMQRVSKSRMEQIARQFNAQTVQPQAVTS